MGDNTKMLYTTEIADKICDALSSGTALVQLCKNEDMPSTTTVFKWIRQHPEFADKYARAREDWCDFEAENIIDIADDKSSDTITDEDGKDRPNTEWISRSRLRVDARKWALSKMNPKKYGERQTIAGDPDAPLGGLTIEQQALSATLTTEQLRAYRDELQRLENESRGA